MFFRAELTDWLKENGDCKRVRHFQKYQKTFDQAMDDVFDAAIHGKSKVSFSCSEEYASELEDRFIYLGYEAKWINGQLLIEW